MFKDKTCVVARVPFWMGSGHTAQLLIRTISFSTKTQSIMGNAANQVPWLYVNTGNHRRETETHKTLRFETKAPQEKYPTHLLAGSAVLPGDSQLSSSRTLEILSREHITPPSPHPAQAHSFSRRSLRSARGLSPPLPGKTHSLFWTTSRSESRDSPHPEDSTGTPPHWIHVALGLLSQEPNMGQKTQTMLHGKTDVGTRR